jgi:hypothetical protein
MVCSGQKQLVDGSTLTLTLSPEKGEGISSPREGERIKVRGVGIRCRS